MKLHIQVVPNAFNESGCVIIISRRWWFLSFELGRVVSVQQLERFMDNFTKLNGRIMDSATYDSGAA